MIKIKCPNCKRRDAAFIKEYKKNWPFGKKSRPRKTLRRKKTICDKCGYIKVEIEIEEEKSL